MIQSIKTIEFTVANVKYGLTAILTDINDYMEEKGISNTANIKVSIVLSNNNIPTSSNLI